MKDKETKNSVVSTNTRSSRVYRRTRGLLEDTGRKTSELEISLKRQVRQIKGGA